MATGYPHAPVPFPDPPNDPDAPPPRRIVRAVNLQTLDHAAAFVRPDGSFQLAMQAPPGSGVQISASQPQEGPLELLDRLKDERQIELEGQPEDVRMMIQGGTSSSPAVLLHVPPRKPEPGAACFGGRIDRKRRVTGTARLQPDAVKPGESARVTVDLTIRCESEEAARACADRPRPFHLGVTRLFDGQGRQCGPSRLLATHVVTPTGLPIETHNEMVGEPGAPGFEPSGPGMPAPHRMTEHGPWERRGRLVAGRVRLLLDMPPRMPEGTYAVHGFFGPAPGEPPADEGPAGRLDLGRLTVGRPPPPRLTAMLLGSAGTGGCRGAVAREDRGRFGINPHTVFQPRALIVPRDDPHTGKPHRYPLDPYLPLVSLTDRPMEARLWPPAIRFPVAPGRLTVTVTRPDGGTDRLGPAPLLSGRNDLTALSPPRMVLDRPVPASGTAYGNPSLCDLYHLSGGGAFDYSFRSYGHHAVKLEGHADDTEGHRHLISGTFDVHVARPLDIEVFPEPGTPLHPKRPLSPQVRILPALPAEVEIVFTHLPGSDASRAVTRRIAGRANRWGIFAPPAPVAFDEPGEYLCDVTVRHMDEAGVWWMACRRGASVVATPDSPISIHGERGTRCTDLFWRPRWFVARNARFLTGATDEDAGLGHSCYPYEGGDVAWLGDRDPDSILPNVTFEDPQGEMAARMEARFPALRRGAGREGLYPYRVLPEDRLAIGEMPFVSTSSTGLPPSLAGAAVDQWGYFYTTSWRPGVSVRCQVSEDMLPAGYWFFDDPYGYQFGAGPQGDLPGDFKMNYAGTVFRDAPSGLKHYGAYASMVAIVDLKRDPMGRRVLPPFDGLLPCSPPSGPLLELAGKRYDLFLTFGATGPGAILETGDRLSLGGVVWPPISGFVAGSITSPDGTAAAFEVPADSMGVFTHDGPVADRPGLWQVKAEGVANGRTSAGTISDLVPKDRWPRGGGIGLKDNTFLVPVVPRGVEPIAFDLPPGARARPPRPLVIRGRLPEGCPARTAGFLASLPGIVIASGELPVLDGGFTYAYDPETLSKGFPNIDTRLPGPDPHLRAPAWFDTVSFTFWAGQGERIRAGSVLLQGEEVYAQARTGRAPPEEPPVAAPPGDGPKAGPARGGGAREPARAASDHSALLVLSRDGRRLHAAHPWSGEVVRLSLDGGQPRVEATGRVGTRVRAIALSPDGRTVYAACDESREVAAFEAETMAVARRLKVGDEPWAVLADPDGAALWVADFDAGTVLRVSAETGQVEAASPPIGRPSCLAWSASDRRLYAVCLRTGSLAVMDARCRLVRRLPAPSQLNQCRAAAFGPDGVLYMPQTRSDTLLGGRMYDRTVFPAVAAAGPEDREVRIAFFPDVMTLPPHRPCGLAADAGAIYLAGAGSDDVLAIDLARRFPRWHARQVGQEPGAIILDETAGRLYVLTLTGQEIVTLAAGDDRVLSRVRFARDPTPAPIARGRYLFGTALDKRITKDQWMSCAACHPDGDTDGRRWDLGQGPLDTRTLRGCLAAAPLHYTAHLDEIQDTHRFTRLSMAGRWFVEPGRMNDELGRANAGIDADADALAAYVAGLKPKRPPAAPPELKPLVERGRAIFFDGRTACAGCHAGPRYTDSGRRGEGGRFVLHDVGTWRPGENEILRRLDTPSLLDLRQSAPYLHDGRAATLEEVFTAHNPADRHGRTSHLSAGDVRALAEFLLRLEPPEEGGIPRPSKER